MPRKEILDRIQKYIQPFRITPILIADVIHGADVRMVECRGRPSLTAKAFQSLVVLR